MATITGGQGCGEISVHLVALGVPRDHWPSIEKSVARFVNVKTATVSFDGWLKVTTDLPEFKEGASLISAVAAVESSILRHLGQYQYAEA